MDRGGYGWFPNALGEDECAVGIWGGVGDAVEVCREAGLVRPLGFEPRTCGLRVRCSAVELEARDLKGSRDASRFSRLGVTEGTRTPDLQGHNLAL